MIAYSDNLHRFIFMGYSRSVKQTICDKVKNVLFGSGQNIQINIPDIYRRDNGMMSRNLAVIDTA